MTELGKTYPHAFSVAHLAIKHGIPEPAPLEGRIVHCVDQLDVIAIDKDSRPKQLFITE